MSIHVCYEIPYHMLQNTIKYRKYRISQKRCKKIEENQELYMPESIFKAEVVDTTTRISVNNYSQKGDKSRFPKKLLTKKKTC